MSTTSHSSPLPLPLAPDLVPCATLAARHADPDGFHLAIVAQVASLYLKVGGGERPGEFSPLVDSFVRAGLSAPRGSLLIVLVTTT